MLTRLLGLGLASAASVFLTAVLSLILGKLLPIDDFGVTRTITAYLVVLTMLGNLTLPDALSYFLAHCDQAQIRKYYTHSSLLVFLFSTVVALISILVFRFSNYWSGNLRNALIISAITLPLINLAILYNSSLQSLGSHRTYAFITLISAVIPLVIITPFSFIGSLDGWITGRVVAAVILLVVVWYPLRTYIRTTPLKLSCFAELLAFSRLQFLSGVLSLVLMSADVILLERLTKSLSITANYGMALLFSKSVLFLPAAIGRAYFKDIALSKNQKNKIHEFLAINIGIGILASLALISIGPFFISQLYGENYLLAAQLLKTMSFGIVFNFLWSGISTINIASGQPASSALISIVGATSGLSLLLIGIPAYGAEGAAWAMNIAYFLGAVTGLFLIWNNMPKSENLLVS